MSGPGMTFSTAGTPRKLLAWGVGQCVSVRVVSANCRRIRRPLVGLIRSGADIASIVGVGPLGIGMNWAQRGTEISALG